MMKNKLVILSLLFSITCSGQVYSMDNNFPYNENDSTKTFIMLKYDPCCKKINGKLPYKFSAEEIYNTSIGQIRIYMERWYIFVKYTFNILKQNSEELKRAFFSNENDNKLIDYAIDIISNYFRMNSSSNKNLYKFKSSYDKKVSISDMATFFDKAYENKTGKKYVRDIIHNNVYSVVIDSLIKQTGLTLNKETEKYYKDTIQISIKDICSKIKNTVRKNIVETSLNRVYLYEHQNISLENINNYLLMIKGIQNDIYDDYKNHILVSSIDSKMYIGICCEMLDPQEDPLIEPLISGGYITDPEIIDYDWTKYIISE